MKLRIILLFVYFLCCSYSAYNQNSAPAKNVTDEIKNLPKIGETDVQGKDRQRVLQIFCQKAAECENVRVIKIEQPRLSKTEVYLVLTGSHSSAYALRYKKKFYVSTKKSDFENFLKSYRILTKPNFPDAFSDVYRYFKFNDAAINPFYIVDAAYLNKYADDLKRYETGYEKISYQSIHPPQTIKTDNADTEIEFYADNPSSGELLKISVVLSPKYFIREKSVSFRLKKPYEIN